MYHTVETKLELSARTFHSYKKMLYKQCVGYARFYEDARRTKHSRIYHCELLKSRGIHIKLACFTFNGFTRFYLFLRINPKRMLNNNDYISVTHESETAAIYEEVNQCLSSIGIYDRFEPFLGDRIDYCCNYRLYDENFSARYMEIMKRSCKLRGFTIKTNYDKIQHRWIPNEDAIYAHNKSVTINIYNKYQQMLKNPPKYTGDLEDYRGIIRFEIQCFKQKLRSMKYTKGLPDMRASHWMKEKSSRETLSFYINKIFCSGDYVTLPEARRIVLGTNFENETKQMMINLLELANEKRSLQKALDIFYNDGFDPKRIGRILKKFNDINVNPTTIPIHWGITHFDSPVKILTRAMDMDNQV